MSSPQLRTRRIWVAAATVIVCVALILTGVFLILLDLNDAKTDTQVFAAGLTIIISAVFLGIAEWLAFQRSRDGETAVPAPGVQGSAPSPILAFEHFSEISISSVINSARRELRVFVVSGRHVLNPQVKELISGKIRDPADSCRIEVLALNSLAEDSAFVRFRDDMMNLADREHNYASDLSAARLMSRQIAALDPAHEKFDMRFYSKMPTTFFLIADGTLYVSFLLSKTVGSSPAFVVRGDERPEIVKAFEDHFTFYWDTSRYFVTVIGFKPSGDFLMVRNRKRDGWEWPAGYVEPNEAPRDSAIREFREETGHEIDVASVKELQASPFGYFFFGTASEEPVSPKSAREVSAVAGFEELPERQDLSFGDDLKQMQYLLAEARRLFEQRMV